VDSILKRARRSFMTQRRIYNLKLLLVALALFVFSDTADAFQDAKLLKTHCAKCHSGEDAEGDFDLHELRLKPDAENKDYWISSLERVAAGEMPPADESRMTEEEQLQLTSFLRKEVSLYEEQLQQPTRVPPRRLNNREFENSIRDVLGIEHIGSHDPTSMLLGDTLHDGFDTHGESLGMSEYHLDQYVTAVRKVLDGVILTGAQPKTKRYTFGPDELKIIDTKNRKRLEPPRRREDGVELLGTRNHIFCDGFAEVPATGNYRIKVKALGVDHHVYDQHLTGIHDDDPILMRMKMGSRHLDFDLPSTQTEFDSEQWLIAGTPIDFSHLTDGLRMIGNGNFKHQMNIARSYIEKNNPKLLHRIQTIEAPKAALKWTRSRPGNHHHYAPYWQGPRPVLCSVTIEGPIFESWPPKRQVELLGKKPSVENATKILLPIAQRAWRRPVDAEELRPIVNLVQTQADSLGDVAALKEGMIAIFVSPSFLMLNPEDSTPEFRFATKLAYLLGSTTPDTDLILKVRRKQLTDIDSIAAELKKRIKSGKADEFLREFPYAWLQLDRINFMAPDIDAFPLYEKKEVSQDMIDEVLTFFRHNIENNHAVAELLTADYSFVNADLAQVYELKNVAHDSKFRKYKFRDGRRGGFLGMGAFLTLTADTLSTSPIHRAVYVMENFMGIHPSPPPSDVDITEPDVRSASTIREVLTAHRSDASCAACHQNIDPYGYAFENFDPIGGWRENYVDLQASAESTPKKKKKPGKKKRNNQRKSKTIPIDASATFKNGTGFKDIKEFRKLMKQDANRDRFVRCFVEKLLTYANGVEPDNYSEVNAIVEASARHDYKLIETIAAVIDSPLFRETN